MASEPTSVWIDSLKKLQRKLRRKANKSYGKIGCESTRLEGIYKGEYLAYSDSANEIEKLIRG